MKFLVASACILLSIVASTQAYSFVIPASPKHPGVCIFNGIFLKPGDNAMPSSCQNMRCNDDGSILVQGCGHFDVKDCRVVDPVNLDKPYPECCKMNFMCAGENGEETERVLSPIEQGIYA